MTKTDRFKFFIDHFTKHSPNAETELIYDNAYQLLVAVMLSAQCTDRRVNVTTPAFFQKFPDPKTLSVAGFDEVLSFIKSISYPNTKAKHLIETAKILQEKYSGEIPIKFEDLISLPGVGRKTANVILSVIANQPTMAVDTHVFRVSARLGLTVRAKTPLATEKQLVKHLPEKYLPVAHHWLILHGRYTCTAKKPKCSECALKSICLFYKNNSKV